MQCGLSSIIFTSRDMLCNTAGLWFPRTIQVSGAYVLAQEDDGFVSVRGAGLNGFMIDVDEEGTLLSVKNCAWSGECCQKYRGMLSNRRVPFAAIRVDLVVYWKHL